MNTENTDTKTPTPRTDAQERLIKANYFHGNIVSPAFARQLETELAAAQQKITQLEADVAMAEDAAKKGEQGRALGTAYEGVCEELKVAQAQIAGLRGTLEGIVSYLESDMLAVDGTAQMINLARKALSAPPPPVVSREQHERVKEKLEESDKSLFVFARQIEDADQDAERLADLVKMWRSDLEGSSGGRALIHNLGVDDALAVHKARKGGK